MHDLATSIGHRVQPKVPGASLRSKVARSSSREDFVRVGLELANSVLGAASSAGLDLRSAKILDFGCGCGRVARHVIEAVPSATLFGVDVDSGAVRWCSKNLKGNFSVVSSATPTFFRSESFDLIYAVSVFTHLDEDSQDRWLAEIRRLLKPEGIFIASTHHPVLTFERPDLSETQHKVLANGFLFAPGGGPPNEDSAFHSPEYLNRHWSGWFRLAAYNQHGLAGYQDLSVWAS